MHFVECFKKKHYIALMGFLKDLLIGGTAYKAYKATKRPGVIEPPGIKMLGMEHEGLGSKWRIHYITSKRVIQI